MQRGGQCSPGLDEKEDEWRLQPGRKTVEGWCSRLPPRLDPGSARRSAAAWSRLVCVEGWSWIVELAAKCLMGHCWAGNVRFSGRSLKNGKKNGNKKEDYRLKTGKRVENDQTVFDPGFCFSCPIFTCFRLHSANTAKSGNGSRTGRDLVFSPAGMAVWMA
jgi:hypothetical protein